MTQKGSLIAIDGPDGSGKTVQAAMLAGRLRELGVATKVTQEPAKHGLGLAIREELMRPQLPWQTAALLFAADRMTQQPTIRGLLDEGTTVIQDRCLVSSLVYQGAQFDMQSGASSSSGYPMGWFHSLNLYVTPPDVLVVLMAPVDVLMGRLELRGAKTVFESRNFLERVHERYSRAESLLPLDWNRTEVHFVDASADRVHVAQSIANVLGVGR